jgi:hypothetical protein
MRRCRMNEYINNVMALQNAIADMTEYSSLDGEVVFDFPKGDGNLMEVNGLDGLYLTAFVGESPRWRLTHEESGFGVNIKWNDITDIDSYAEKLKKEVEDE